MKFKAGDRVIYINSDWYFEKGAILTISKYKPYLSDSGHWCYFVDEFISEPITEFRIELVEVYNSPLYQALL